MFSRYPSLSDFINRHIESDIPLSSQPQVRLVYPVDKDGDEWTLDRSHIITMTKLYSGAFGSVSEAIIRATKEKVMAKSYRHSTRSMEATNQFHLEVSLLKEYSHPNIVRYNYRDCSSCL